MPASGPVSEGQRLALLNRLCEVLGEEEARTFMESLPAVHWHDLATKDDLKASEERIRTEMNGKFAEMNGKFAALTAEIRGEFVSVYAEFKTLRAENKEHRGEMALQFAKQTRMMVFTMLGLAVPILGAILGVGLT